MQRQNVENRRTNHDQHVRIKQMKYPPLSESACRAGPRYKAFSMNTGEEDSSAVSDQAWYNELKALYYHFVGIISFSAVVSMGCSGSKLVLI